MKKLIAFIILLCIVTTTLIYVSATPIFDRNNIVRENVDFTESYDAMAYKVMRYQYTPGGIFSNGKVNTQLSGHTAFYSHTISQIQGSDLEYYYNIGESYDDTVVNPGYVSCGTDYAIYTYHFCEVWEEYDSVCLYWFTCEKYAGAAPEEPPVDESGR